MEKKITIIVTVYNREKYLDRCLKSISNQTYKNLEVIIIDDGSTDNGKIIYEKWMNIDSRMKAYYKENGGRSSARNMGLDKATGEYIGFVDADDYVNPQMYKKMVTILEKEKADMAVCDYKEVDTEEYKLYNCGKTNLEILSGKEAMYKLYCVPPDKIYWVAPWNKLYKSEIFENLRFPLGKDYEDNYLYHHILGRVDKIVYTRQELVYYFQSQEGIMRSSYSKNNLDDLYSFEDRMIFFQNRKYKKLLSKASVEFFNNVINHGCLLYHNKIWKENKFTIIKFIDRNKVYILKTRSLKMVLKIMIFRSAPESFVKFKYHFRNNFSKI